MSKTLLTIDRRIELFVRRGWCPIRWAHHPQPIKDLIRAGGCVPKLKCCYENSARLVMTACGTEYESRLRYCEGWASTIIPIAHAWLTLDDEIVDLTLGTGDDYPPIYGEHRSFSVVGTVAMIAKAGTYGPLTNLWKIGPYAAAARAAGWFDNNKRRT